MTPPRSTPPHPRGTDSGHGGENAGSPSEIARETLRQLALRKVPPTPDNYRELYFRIRGSTDDDIFPVRTLKTIANALSRTTPAEMRSAQAFEAAAASGKWPELHRVITDMHTSRSGGGKAWNTLVRDLVLQFEHLHLELTQARKREALNHVLSAHPDADILYERLNSLVRSWKQSDSCDAPPLDGVDAAGAAGAAGTAGTAGAAGTAGTAGTAGAADAADAAGSAAVAPECGLSSPGLDADDTQAMSLRPLLAKLLTNGVIPLADNDEPLAGEARSISNTLLDAGGPAAREDIAARLEQLIVRMEWVGEERQAVREALLGLLKLLISNIRELVIDDNWLYGQLTAISAAFSGPISLRVLDDIARQLQDVIDKQSRLKHDLAEAHGRLKEMLASFIDRLSEAAIYTRDYHDFLGRSAKRIGEAASIAELSEVVGELLDGTRSVQESTLRVTHELTELRELADNAKQEIVRLHSELDATSRLIRHDPLTGALNRRGLDEALVREISRMNRKSTALCVALIDIDNFKKLNDAYGHNTGDEALCHLTRTVTEALRPQDVVARYGGEEFIILLPDTMPEAANIILTRLQRELTRRIFCAPNSERLLITFSAGIAQVLPGEQPDAAIARADNAMYAAKRAGKNRVLVAV